MGGLISPLCLNSAAHGKNVSSRELAKRDLAHVFIQPVIEQRFRFRLRLKRCAATRPGRAISRARRSDISSAASAPVGGTNRKETPFIVDLASLLSRLHCLQRSLYEHWRHGGVPNWGIA